MKLRLEAILNTFKDSNRFSYSGGEILLALIQELRSAGFMQYIYNGYNFDGGPGYEAEYFVLTWFEDNSLHSIEWVEECY